MRHLDLTLYTFDAQNSRHFLKEIESSIFVENLEHLSISQFRFAEPPPKEKLEFEMKVREPPPTYFEENTLDILNKLVGKAANLKRLRLDHLEMKTIGGKCDVLFKVSFFSLRRTQATLEPFDCHASAFAVYNTRGKHMYRTYRRSVELFTS